MKRSFQAALALAALACVAAPAHAGKASPGAETDPTVVLQQMYDLLAVPSGQRLRAVVTDVQPLDFAGVADSRYLDWVEFTGQRLKMDKLWSYQDDRGCVGLEIRFEKLPLNRLALASVSDMTLAQALAYKEANQEIPPLAGLTGLYAYGVQLSADGQVWSYRALALDYVSRERPLLIEPMLWSLNVVAERLARQTLCSGAAGTEDAVTGETDATAACTANTATNYFSPAPQQSNAGHNSTTSTYCRGAATFKFVRTCSTSCLLTHTPSISSSSCTADDGYWNSFEDTDTDTATHGCSNSSGAACAASAAFHCVTRHCAFPCSATASVEWNGNGFTWGSSDHLNAKLSWTHTPTRCN